MSSKKDEKRESPTSDVEEETEADYSSEDVGPEAPLFGSIRTRLRWEADSSTMHLDVKQFVQNKRKLVVKYRGQLNTQSGQYNYTAQVQRLMTQNTPSLARIMAAERGITLDGEEDIDPHRFLPAGLKTLLFKDWTLAPGLRVTSQRTPAAPAAAAQEPGAAGAAAAGAAGGTAAVVPVGSSSSSSSGDGGLRYCVTLKKQPQVLLRRGAWESWLEGKADLEMDPRAQGLGFRSGVRLKVLRYNLTDKQDLQLALGADYGSSSSSNGGKAAGDGSSDGCLTPYLKLSENSWAVRLSRGQLSFTYDM